jgi:hypothetical protein
VLGCSTWEIVFCSKLLPSDPLPWCVGGVVIGVGGFVVGVGGFVVGVGGLVVGVGGFVVGVGGLVVGAGGFVVGVGGFVVGVGGFVVGVGGLVVGVGGFVVGVGGLVVGVGGLVVGVNVGVGVGIIVIGGVGVGICVVVGVGGIVGLTIMIVGVCVGVWMENTSWWHTRFTSLQMIVQAGWAGLFDATVPWTFPRVVFCGVLGIHLSETGTFPDTSFCGPNTNEHFSSAVKLSTHTRQIFFSAYISHTVWFL